MLDFRKVILAVGVAALGLVGTASAQVSCTAAVSVPSLGALRADGTTEQLPAMTLGTPTACTGNINTSTISIVLQTSLPISNVPLTGSTTGQVDAIATLVSNAVSYYAIGTASGASALSFNFTGVATGNPLTSITFSNVRVNASVVAAQTIVTATALATSGISATGGAGNVGFTQPSFQKPAFTGYTNVQACNVGANDVNAVGVVKLTEGFVSAFTQDADQVTEETNGFTTPDVPGLGAGVTNPIATAANDQGQHLALTFSNLATAGVIYYLPVQVVSGGLTLNLVASATADQTKIATGVAVGTAANAGNFGAGGAVGVAGNGGLFAFTPTSGSFTAYYAVATDNQGTIDATTAPISGNAAALGSEIILFETIANPSLVVPGAGAPTVSVASVGNTAPYYAGFAAPASPTVVTASSFDPIAAPDTTHAGTGALSTCNTTVLFPFVSNQGGYDTGIAISNASTVPTGSTTTAYGTASATSGSCNAYFYGANPPSTNPYSVGTITSGSSAVFDVQTVAPNFSGYVVVTCNFTGAHGYAFVSNGLGTGNGTSTSYLGVILGDPALAQLGVTAQ